MKTNKKLVNAWIFLNEDEPASTSYHTPGSCYQTLIQDNIYQSIDILYICYVTTMPANAATIPPGDGSSYTINISAASHPGGLSNQNYMDYLIRDARKNNPDIKIAVTLNRGGRNLLSNIFLNSDYSPQQNAASFAANLMAYLKHHDLDGFDIGWQYPVSEQTSRKQLRLLLNAIGAQFKQQTDKRYYLSLSPAEINNLDAPTVNNNVDFINLQLYAGINPDAFINAGFNEDIFAYGAKFEPGYQTALRAFQDNEAHYHYNAFTCWRLNSGNYQFEQAQQKLLHQLIDTQFLQNNIESAGSNTITDQPYQEPSGSNSIVYRRRRQNDRREGKAV